MPWRSGQKTATRTKRSCDLTRSPTHTHSRAHLAQTSGSVKTYRTRTYVPTFLCLPHPHFDRSMDSSIPPTFVVEYKPTYGSTSAPTQCVSNWKECGMYTLACIWIALLPLVRTYRVDVIWFPRSPNMALEQLFPLCVYVALSGSLWRVPNLSPRQQCSQHHPWYCSLTQLLLQSQTMVILPCAVRKVTNVTPKMTPTHSAARVAQAPGVALMKTTQ